jgi:hypothetical protein
VFNLARPHEWETATFPKIEGLRIRGFKQTHPPLIRSVRFHNFESAILVNLDVRIEAKELAPSVRGMLVFEHRQYRYMSIMTVEPTQLPTHPHRLISRL